MKKTALRIVKVSPELFARAIRPLLRAPYNAVTLREYQAAFGPIAALYRGKELLRVDSRVNLRKLAATMKPNPAGAAAWRARGFRAGVSGKFRESSDAWNTQTGKPTRKVTGLGGELVESGRYIEAHDYFLEGFHLGAEKRERMTKTNPALKRTAPKGWQAATAVKIIRRGGQTVVLIRKAPRKRAKKKAAAKRRR